MPYIGEIKVASRNSVGSKWLSLIDSHAALGHPPPRMGINPFTRKPQEFYAPGSSAQVLREGVRVGGIQWAMDDSPWLLVDADDECIEYVANIAEDVAKILDAYFIREPLT